MPVPSPLEIAAAGAPAGVNPVLLPLVAEMALEPAQHAALLGAWRRYQDLVQQLRQELRAALALLQRRAVSTNAGLAEAGQAELAEVRRSVVCLGSGVVLLLPWRGDVRACPVQIRGGGGWCMPACLPSHPGV